MKRTIVNPHWINNARSIISADFQYEDGRIVTVNVSGSETTNPDLIEINEKFTTEQIEENTKQKIKEISNQKIKQKEIIEAQALRKQQEELFAAKLRIFEIDTIKTSTNRVLKSKIRKSKSDVEAMAWAVALMLNEFNNEVADTEETTPGV
jgi:hypothetical protein